MPKKEDRQQKEVQEGGSKEAAQNDDGQWALDLIAGFPSAQGQGKEGQSRDESGHQNGSQALHRAIHHHLPEGHALGQ